MRIACFVLFLASLLAACKSKTPKTMSEIMSPRFGRDVQTGSYYRTTGLTTGFYVEQPDSLIHKSPAKLLGPRHVIQLLEPNAGGGWARVRNEDGNIGFVKFSSIKIVPFDEQPRAPKKKREFWNDD